jgi:hypothetical protein
MILDVVRGLRAIAKSTPQASGEIQQINDLLRKVMVKTMQHAQPGEAMAPPS